MKLYLLVQYESSEDCHKETLRGVFTSEYFLLNEINNKRHERFTHISNEPRLIKTIPEIFLYHGFDDYLDGNLYIIMVDSDTRFNYEDITQHENSQTMLTWTETHNIWYPTKEQFECYQKKYIENRNAENRNAEEKEKVAKLKYEELKKILA